MSFLFDVNVLQPLVWLDARLALLVAVILPGLWSVWAWRSNTVPIWRSLMIYWRVVVLLPISLYLFMGGLGVAYWADVAWRWLVVAALWFWVDLNEDIASLQSDAKADRGASALGFAYGAWRWAMTVYGVVTGGMAMTFANCGTVPLDKLSDVCLAWHQPALSFKSLFHQSAPVDNMTFVGVVCLAVYLLYFGIFFVFTLPKNGRISQRD